jgi:hypothetical protein
MGAEAMTTAQVDSKRIRKFRDGIIQAVPRFPNDKASKAVLERQSLGTLLVVYMSWRMRIVPPLARLVTTRQTATSDDRWCGLKSNVDAFLDKVRRGEDLTPHLSIAAWQKGYAPAAHGAGNAADRWVDKDFLLNVMGFHHFHLGTKLEKNGFVTRTDVVLFGYVTRTTFDVLGLFDHSVFDNEDTTVMTFERARFWELHENILLEGIEPGSFILANLISGSGHTSQVVLLAQRYAKLIKRIDPHLDDRSYVKSFLYGGRFMTPAKPKLRWAFKHLDLYLADDASATCFIMQRGPA